MSDVGDMAEMVMQGEQPGEAVVAEPEEVTPPQGDDSELELYVETEGDQIEPNKTNMSREQAYAAFRKEKEKRQRKNEELEASKRREEELIARLAALEGTVTSIKKGPPPTLESCDYDEAKFQEMAAAYYQNQSSSAQAPTTSPASDVPKQNAPIIDDEAEFYLYEKEQDLKQHFPDYETDKSQLVEKLQQYGGGQHSLNEMANIANQRGLDIARAVLAMNRNPILVDQLVRAYSRGPFAVEEVLKRAESKIQTRQRKPLNSQPEPSINNSGPIDNKSATVAKARQAWVDAEPHDQPQRWREYQAAKRL